MSRFFGPDDACSYLKQEVAMGKAEAILKKHGKSLDTVRWVMGVNDRGRFAVILIGREYFDFVHAGLRVTG